MLGFGALVDEDVVASMRWKMLILRDATGPWGVVGRRWGEKF